MKQVSLLMLLIALTVFSVSAKAGASKANVSIEKNYAVVALYLHGNPKQNAKLTAKVINEEISKLGKGWVYDSYIEQSKNSKLLVFRKNK